MFTIFKILSTADMFKTYIWKIESLNACTFVHLHTMCRNNERPECRPTGLTTMSQCQAMVSHTPTMQAAWLATCCHFLWSALRLWPTVSTHVDTLHILFHWPDRPDPALSPAKTVGPVWPQPNRWTRPFCHSHFPSFLYLRTCRQEYCLSCHGFSMQTKSWWWAIITTISSITTSYFYLWRFDLYQRASSEEVCLHLLLPVLATVVMWCGKKTVVRMAQCVAPRVMVDRSLPLLTDVDICPHP